jgi:hypothetical protein
VATLGEIETALNEILTDTSLDLTARINQAVTAIAGGIRMPDASGLSPPLPDLLEIDTVGTTTTYCVDLPDTYQRNLFYIADSSGNKIWPPKGGDYYSFTLFMNGLYDKSLGQSGSVDRCVVRGTKLYYQGIPTTSEGLTLYFYRKPVDMALPADTPDGIPSHLQLRLVKHYVCKEAYGEALEDGDESSAVGASYHTEKFYEAMIDLIYHIGEDAEPEYYAGPDAYLSDGAICD